MSRYQATQNGWLFFCAFGGSSESSLFAFQLRWQDSAAILNVPLPVTSWAEESHLQRLRVVIVVRVGLRLPAVLAWPPRYAATANRILSLRHRYYLDSGRAKFSVPAKPNRLLDVIMLSVFCFSHSDTQNQIQSTLGCVSHQYSTVLEQHALVPTRHAETWQKPGRSTARSLAEAQQKPSRNLAPPPFCYGVAIAALAKPGL